MANVGPRTPVQPQPAAAPRFGLLASIPPTTDQARWELGIAYMPEGCGAGSDTFGDLCDPDPSSYPERGTIVEWDPYAITVSDTCSTFSRMLDDEEQARILRILNADTENQLGREFWTGAQAQATAGSPNSYLTNHAATEFVDLTGSSAATYLEAISCLDQFLAENNSGQQGAIHASVQLITAWESFRLVRREGNKVLTFQDTYVIGSPGYPGNGPDYLTGEMWAYATDMPRIFLGDPKAYATNNVIDRQNNIREAKGERVGLVEWERCRHAGIQVDMALCGVSS